MEHTLIHRYMRRSLIPETKNKSLEEMDIIFGAVSAEERQAYINKREKGKTSLEFFSEFDLNFVI